MHRLLLPAFLALALYATPVIAVAQEATPSPACPGDEFPAVGALRLTDGAVAWLACSSVEAYRHVVGASESVVLVEESGPAGQHTIAFDAADGSELWRISTADAPVPTGPFDGQGIVVLATDGQDGPALVGLDAVTGEEQWRVGSSDVPIAHSATVAVVAEPVSPGPPSRFRGIDRVTGEELWVSDTPLEDMSGVFVARSPVAVLGDAIVVPTGATVTALDMRTGDMLWQAPQLDHPAAADGVIVGTRGTNVPPPPLPEVAALDAASGELLWAAPGRSSYGDLLAVGDGVVVVLDPDDGSLVAYALASGDERWHVTQATSYGEPQLISGTSLVLLWEDEVSVVSTTDGATTWSATEPFGSPLMNSVSSNGDAAFVAINSLPWGD